VELFDKKELCGSVYSLDLTGSYQLKNLLGVLNTIDVLIQKGFVIEQKDIKKALSNTCKLTKFEGRWQTVSEKPLIIADTGHNEDGIEQVLANLKRYTFKQLHCVFGTVNDKEVEKILKMLPKNAIYYFVKASVPRALDSIELQKKAAVHKLNGNAYDSVEKGLKVAKKACKSGDLIFVGGSTFVVADLLNISK
jgi:dihydrofolate synthase/folylpolyglutamate synthase